MNPLGPAANFTDHRKLPGFQAGEWGQDGVGRNKEEEGTSEKNSWWELEVGRYKQQLNLIVLGCFSSRAGWGQGVGVNSPVLPWEDCECGLRVGLTDPTLRLFQVAWPP